MSSSATTWWILPALVREHPSEPEHRVPDALEACLLTRAAWVADGVGGHYLGERYHVARGHDLLVGPARDRLDVVVHGSVLQPVDFHWMSNGLMS